MSPYVKSSLVEWSIALIDFLCSDRMEYSAHVIPHWANDRLSLDYHAIDSFTPYLTLAINPRVLLCNIQFKLTSVDCIIFLIGIHLILIKIFICTCH